MYEVSKRTLFQVWYNSTQENKSEEMYDSVLKTFDIPPNSISSETRLNWKKLLRNLNCKLRKKWNEAGKRMDRFLEKNNGWLDSNFIQFQIVPFLEDYDVKLQQGKLGRPPKHFQEVQHRTKKQKVQHLLASTTEEITFAAEISLRNDGKRDAANLVKEIASASSDTSTKLKHLRQKQNCEKSRQYSKEEALALFVDCRLTKQSYINLRKSALEAGHDLYPSYKQIQKAKQECAPPPENIFVNETRAEVNLQSILDHTAKRLLQSQETVLQQYALSRNLQVLDLLLVSKYGCDGSSGHSRYKQKFEGQEVNDENLFVYSFVPIKLLPQNNHLVHLWQNDRPSSTKLCRPIKFLISKETTEMVNAETQIIKNEISSLVPTNLHLGNVDINIYHELHLTMIDGKLCNILTDTKSSQTCYICGATPKNMNTKPNLNRNPKNYEFGLSTLHARIRTFECLLHIGYKLEMKQWQAKGKEQQEQVKVKKLEMQKRFKSEMGLDVDRPKQGFGSSNDGNTARAFFNNPQKSSDITGVDRRLIEQFSVILDVVSSGFDINCTKFEKYCNDTAELYLSLYSWYYMPVTVHKLLFHSTEIIKHCIVPIGQLSEEAQEARHKDCRRYREHNTQKISRSATNKDLFTMLLISSDPVIFNYRQKSEKPKKPLSSEVLGLLKCPELPSCSDSENDSEFESESD